MRAVSFLLALILVVPSALGAPLDNKDGFWSDWSDGTFARAAAEKNS